MGPEVRFARRRSDALICLALAASAMGEEPPAPTPPERPIAASVDRLLKRLEEKWKEPCRQALADDVPCFPVTVERDAPEYSVAQSLRDFVPDDSPSPSRPPTLTEIAPYRPGPVRPMATFLKVDPTCVAKSALKKLKGKNDVYYLYRLKDRRGERPVLTERPLDPATYSALPDLHYELLGKFDGECEAVAAYRRIERGIGKGGAKGDRPPR